MQNMMFWLEPRHSNHTNYSFSANWPESGYKWTKCFMMHQCAIERQREECEAVKKTTVRQTNNERSAASGEQLLLNRVTHTTNCSSLGINSPTQSTYNKASLSSWPFNCLICVCLVIWNVCASTKYCYCAWTEIKIGACIHSSILSWKWIAI